MMFGRWGNPDEQRVPARWSTSPSTPGVTLFDTADIYDFGVSEEFLGRALAGRRDRVVLATKVRQRDERRSRCERGLSRRWITQSCDASLRRLGTDYIDLYQMHRPDPDTPIDETLQAFDDLVKAGKVRAIGTSTFSRRSSTRPEPRAERLGVTVPSASSRRTRCSCARIEAEVLPWCQQHDVGVLVWAPLNGGWLTGKYQSDSVDDRLASRPRARPLRPSRRGDPRRRNASCGRLVEPGRRVRPA